MDAIIDRINNYQLKDVPFIINEIIEDRHYKYVTEQLDGKFAGNKAVSHGMRYSIYCAEQIAYSDKELIQKQEKMMPWYEGYQFNNVSHAICDCWKVKPAPAITKTPLYSNIPALIAAGNADPWCRPFYNKLIKRTMPNSQLITVHNNAHGAMFKVEGVDFLKMFMENSRQKIILPVKHVTIE